ncbi:MAG: hypothetical protein EAZ15_03455 [Sphingobacteriales bacterium]|nr:MAG: hypothetical protein EAZ15_03455 [Sphingobacteriales bacterium]
MNTKVAASLKAAFNTFAKEENVNGEQALKSLEKLFSADYDFMTKVDKLDEIFDNESDLDALREITFDLLLINFFSEDAQKLDEDYLESAQWEAIEEETIDRGTELLNLLLYLKECEDEEIEPSLDDYLKEFLLVEEDEFQDEHRIYEDIIANQILMESGLEEIAKVSKNLSEESDMKELFYPLMAFFLDSDPDKETVTKFMELSEDAPFDGAILDLLVSYNNAR